MLIPPAYAQAAGAQSAGGAAFFLNLAPLLFIFVIFWFLLIRPQQKRMKEHRAKLDAVRKGDQVVTGGGLVGRVTKVEDNQVEVEIAPNVRVKAIKATLSDVAGATGGAKPAND